MKLNKKQTLTILSIFVIILLIGLVVGFIYIFKNINKDKTINCEDYSFQDCPDECQRYIGPSYCGFDIGLMMEVCTDDWVEKCLPK